MDRYDVIIVGGGLAGLTSAIHLSKSGYKVAVFEKQSYPNHKVCGEYVSNEINPYLESLGITLVQAGAVAITEFVFSTRKGESCKTKLPIGGMGISRFALDDLLYKKAKSQKVIFHFQKVVSVVYKDDDFTVITATKEMYTSKIVIGAYGKRSILDKFLNRDFSFARNSWMAVKAHYKNTTFPNNIVALHSFNGGYGGLSKTETGAVNFCYLTNYKSFQNHNSISDFNKKVVGQNPYLNDFLSRSEPIFNNPLTIAQISFQKKAPVVDHVLMCGDTAGLIHPLCGNGMAMAIHSAKIGSELIEKYFGDNNYDRNKLEKEYLSKWNSAFRTRLWAGRRLQSLLLHEGLLDIGVKTIGRSDRILRFLIAKTHGKPIVC